MPLSNTGYFIYEPFVIYGTVNKTLPNNIKYKMKARKTFFILLGIFLFALILLGGAGLYYYTHPSMVKALVERGVSGVTGAPFSIRHLDYSLSPIKLHAKGIVFKPAGEGNGFSAEIEDFMADCVLNGSFGQKTLVFKNLKVNGFKCRVLEGVVPSVSKDPVQKGSSFLSTIARSFVSVFLFKDFSLARAEIGEGFVSAQRGGRRIEISGLSGHMNADHMLDVQGIIRVESLSEQAIFSVPGFHIKTTTAVSLNDPRIAFTVAFIDGLFRSPQAKVESIEGFATIGYDHSDQKFVFADVKFAFKTTHLKGLPKTENVPFEAVLKASGEVDLEEGKARLTDFSFDVKHPHFNGLLTAELEAERPLSNLQLSGKLTGSKVSFKWKGLSVKGAEGALIFSGSYPDFEVAEFSCGVPEIKSLTDKETFSVEQIEIVSTKGHVNVLERSLNFPEIRFKSSLLSNILATVQMDKGRLKLTAKGKEVGLVHSASRLKLLPPGWTFRGMDTIDVTASLDKKGTISFSAKLGLEKFQFHNPKETHVGENISFHALISGRTTSDPSTIKASAQLSADGGEVLMDRYYFNLGENTLSVQGDGVYQGKRKSMKLDKLTLNMKKIATAHVTGTLFQSRDGLEGELDLRIPDIPLKEPFQRLIREPFQTEKPALSKVRVDGSVGAAMAFKGKRSSWMITGHCTWKDGALVYGDSSVNLTGIGLSLPVWLTHENGDGPMQAPKGHLSIRSMWIPHLPDQDLNVPIQAAQNGLIMPAATTLVVPGGTVRMGPSRIGGLTGASPTIDTALHFENLQLEPVLSRIWPEALTGNADGNLNTIHIEGGALQSTGEIKANVFEGALTLSHVGARGLFTALPIYHLDAQWHHLNLAEMTEGTSFGKIEGILNGYAKNLEVSNGQLQRFDLLLDTVKTDDVPQKISVKAVDNIARLGGGQSPFAGVAGMFVSFFKEFPYRKIGVRATLENDVFRINGTIRENGNEYLVKRGFFSGVDVINQNKDNRVSFKDMLKRIKRISNSKDGPVIR